jgi:hypothetical protein
MVFPPFLNIALKNLIVELGYASIHLPHYSFFNELALRLR